MAKAQGHAVSSWEQFLKSWEADREKQDEDDQVETGFEAVTPELATQELGSYIIDLKLTGKLTAKDACTLSWWIHKCGVEGVVAELGMQPGRSSGNYAKHFDRVIGASGPATADDLYIMKAPGYQRSTDSRVLREHHTLPPLEAADEEIRGTPDMAARLEERRLAGALPPAYEERRLAVAAEGTPVYPYSLYIDAVHFMRTDAVIGIWLCSLITGVRHLLAALRKSEMCACGCRGWCTMYTCMSMLHWSFLHMARGRAPSARHDGKPFGDEEGVRSAIADAALGWRAIILHIKCDMMEYVTSFGFPSWSTSKAPCPLCYCNHDNWGDIAGISPLTAPWPLKAFADYAGACDQCEHPILVKCPSLFRFVRANLRYDKKAGGSRGRALMADVPALGLRKGDRLEPWSGMHDVGEIDIMDPQSACRLLFWRRSAETHVRHRNPIFSEETGILPECVLVVDWLHTLSLGVYKYYIAHLWHTLFDHDVFKVGECTSEEFLLQSVARLRNDLFRWYDSELAAGRAHSRVQNLTPEMVGRSAAHKLGTWGAETNGLLFFSQHLLRQALPLPKALKSSLVKGCDSLVELHTIIKQHTGATCPPAVACRFADNVKRHLHSMRELGIAVRAKHHALAHMAHKILTLGMPAMWACWTDESENKLLAQLALRAHRMVWSRSLITTHRLAFGARRDLRLKR